jgi:hypothetical protein
VPSAHAEHERRQDSGDPAIRRISERTPPAVPAVPHDPADLAFTPENVLALQRTIGNAAVVRLLRRAREAAAAAVTPDAPARDSGESQDTPAPVQRSGVQEVLRSPGKPLNDTVRRDMESKFDADFSGVRLHTGATAQRSADVLGARAYTSGEHVVIGRGGSDPHTLAHELTHVIQQRSGPVAGTDTGNGLRVSDPSDRFEREAEAAAARLTARPAAGGHNSANRGEEYGESIQRSILPNPLNLTSARSEEGQRKLIDTYLEAMVGQLKKELTGRPEEARADILALVKEVTGLRAFDKRAISIADIAGRISSLDGRFDRLSGDGTVRVPNEVIDEIADPRGRVNTYAGGSGRMIPKTPERVACWEWAVRAGEESGGIDRGAFWDYFNNFGVPEFFQRNFDEIEAAVKAQMAELKGELEEAGMAPGPAGVDTATNGDIRPFMERSVRLFVKAHGLQVDDSGNPAAWVVCHYKKSGGSGGIGVPDHWWIELPTSQGGRVLIQTVPGVPYFEAGDQNLRWNDAGGIRRGGHEEYATCEVPVAALKGRHVEILKKVLLERRAESSSSSGFSGWLRYLGLGGSR